LLFRYRHSPENYGYTLVCYRLDDRDSIPGRERDFFAAAYRLALKPIHPPIQWVPRLLSAGVKWLGREVDHSPLSSAEVKNAWSYIRYSLRGA